MIDVWVEQTVVDTAMVTAFNDPMPPGRWRAGFECCGLRSYDGEVTCLRIQNEGVAHIHLFLKCVDRGSTFE